MLNSSKTQSVNFTRSTPWSKWGWPETKPQVPHSIRQYWDKRDELAVLDGVIYRGMRIIIPPSMRPAMLAVIHGTRLGIVKCKQRAIEAPYWPGMSAQIEVKVKDCTICHDCSGATERATDTKSHLWPPVGDGCIRHIHLWEQAVPSPCWLLFQVHWGH